MVLHDAMMLLEEEVVWSNRKCVECLGADEFGKVDCDVVKGLLTLVLVDQSTVVELCSVIFSTVSPVALFL